MNQWALPTIAVLLIGYGAVSGRLLGFGLPLTIVAGTLAGLALFPQLDLWTAAALATILAPTDAALGCRWSATGGSPPASARASTSRAA